MMKTKRLFGAFLALALLASVLCPAITALAEGEETITLRICNWEEYIDQGDWDDEEEIDLREEEEETAEEDENADPEEEGEDPAEAEGEEEEEDDPEGRVIFGENSMVEDFEAWYEETYGRKVKVEYSTFGTNEDLYNMLTIGDVYDLVCPSEYMIMKLMAEDKVQPLSEEFFYTEGEGSEYNYYIKGVSPYIREIFETHEINGVKWSQCAAGYMWGITGFVYNPEEMTEEEASTWKLLENTKFERQITMKDNVRDSYFAAVGALKSDLLKSEEFTGSETYAEDLQAEMNDVTQEMADKAQDYLQKIKDNLYSFETDSGKADMITGKVVANYQWSGDAVYTMDQADEDDYTLNFAIPEECTNIYFDGWIMLKSGIDGDSRKQHAAEAFINFVSRPDNVIRNMYYIGYTSTISGGEDGRIFDYLEWTYGAEEDETDTEEYDVGYFFAKDGEDEGEYVLTVPAEQLNRQLSAQYPTEEVIHRASIMEYFDENESEIINRMWIRVRCFNIGNVPVWAWIGLGAVLAGGICFFIQRKIGKKRMYQ